MNSSKRLYFKELCLGFKYFKFTVFLYFSKSLKNISLNVSCDKVVAVLKSFLF